MGRTELTFESEVTASPADAWRWITSVKSIKQEMWPFFRMTAPRGMENLKDLDVTLGKPLFRSRIYMLGFLPIGHSDLTLVEMREGDGFIERSPMSGMKLWQHDRRIEATPYGSKVIDHLTIEPKWASGITTWYLRHTFRHRHKVIESHLGKHAG